MAAADFVSAGSTANGEAGQGAGRNDGSSSLLSFGGKLAKAAGKASPSQTSTSAKSQARLKSILDNYQVRDDKIVDYTPNLGPFPIDVPFAGSKRMTETEAKLLDNLGSRKGLLGLKKFRDITSNDPNDLGQAYSTANKYFPQTDAAGKLVRGGEDGHNDAFRHAYWNALMTKNFGEKFAAAFGTAHEGVPGNPADKEAMDLFNNELGRRIATENPNASDEELADLIFKAINNGEAVVIDGGNNLAFSNKVAVGATGTADDPPRNGTLTAPPEGPGSL